MVPVLTPHSADAQRQQSCVDVLHCAPWAVNLEYLLYLKSDELVRHNVRIMFHKYGCCCQRAILFLACNWSLVSNIAKCSHHNSYLLLLLLRSQLCLWSLPFLVQFLDMWPFFNPTIGIATTFYLKINHRLFLLLFALVCEGLNLMFKPCLEHITKNVLKNQLNIVRSL